MKYHVIGDEDTVLGFRYAGVQGDAVEDAESAARALEGVLRRPDISILILTDAVADLIRDEVNDVRFRRTKPLVAEIPGPSGPADSRQDLLTLIREAVGIKV
ncbi:Vacuolar H+transporting two-sector ATPase F subunit [bacterium]|nr:Vacuolar H+transporting two-sector ATPase F subunit [bacterium]